MASRVVRKGLAKGSKTTVSTTVVPGLDEIAALRVRDTEALFGLVASLNDLKRAAVESIGILHAEQGDAVAAYNAQDGGDSRAPKAASRRARTELERITRDVAKAAAALREGLPKHVAHSRSLSIAARILGIAAHAQKALPDLVQPCLWEARQHVGAALGRDLVDGELTAAFKAVMADRKRVKFESGRDAWSQEGVALLVLVDLGYPGTTETLRKRIKGER